MKSLIRSGPVSFHNAQALKYLRLGTRKKNRPCLVGNIILREKLLRWVSVSRYGMWLIFSRLLLERRLRKRWMLWAAGFRSAQYINALGHPMQNAKYREAMGRGNDDTAAAREVKNICERRTGAEDVPEKQGMSKTIREIYKNLIQELDEDEFSCALKKEILELLGDAGAYPDMQTYERCRDKAFRIAGSGEEAGFCRGFRYAFQLFMECR